MQDILIISGGGFAREVAWVFECMAKSGQPVRVRGFIEKDGSPRLGTSMNELPIMDLAEAKKRFPHARLNCAAGDPRLRERLAVEASSEGFGFASAIHPGVEISRYIEVGEGIVICAGVKLTTNIKIGSHVHINLNCTIGHDATLEDFVTLAPGVHVSGHVHLARGAFLGTGAVLINGTDDCDIRVGAYATVGAAACVIKDVDPGVVVVGVPARPKGS